MKKKGKPKLKIKVRPKLEPMVGCTWDDLNFAEYTMDLFIRFLEQEAAAMFGKAMCFDGNGGYLPPGVMPTPGHSLDDVGAAFRARNMTSTDQKILVTRAVGRTNEWENLMRALGLSRVDFKESLRIAWLKLCLNLYSRQMIRHSCE